MLRPDYPLIKDLMTFQPSERLMDFAFNALEEALLQLKRQGSLTLFVLLMNKEGVILQRFMDTEAESALARAEAQIRTSDAETLAYALVYDTLMSIHDRDYDSIIIEVGERGASHAYRFAQRYQPMKNQMPLYPIGELAYLSTIPLLL